jgi:hypothetical protein
MQVQVSAERKFRRVPHAFQQESLDLIDERLFDLALAARVGGAQEVEQVRIFEDLGGEVGLAGEKPFMSGNASRRSAARRSITFAPHPTLSCRSRIVRPMSQ